MLKFVCSLSQARLASGSTCSFSSTVVRNQDPLTPNNSSKMNASCNSRQYGQPTADTHPHLLKQGEVTPGITLEEYQSRRRRLMHLVRHFAQHLTHQTKQHIVIIPSHTKLYMSEKIPYPFRQNSDFLYLTGFQEPDSVLILKSKDDSGEDHEEIICVPKHDPHSELWDGPVTGADGAIQLLGVNEAYNRDELPKLICTLFRDIRSTALWCDFQNFYQPFVEQTLKAAIADNSPKYVSSPRPLIQQLRLIKSPAESALMARSCEIASKSFEEVIKNTLPLVSEHQLYAKMDYCCRNQGADRLAYPPVVAGGDRGNIIHYISNNSILLEGEMVLMDAGCEYGGYSSDITRSWPVAKAFLPLHRELYEAVLCVQEQLIEVCSPRISLDQLYTKMIELLAQYLQELRIIPKSASNAERLKIAQKYCPHHVGHYLGMDVHDTPLVTRSRPLEPGMVITIEPGVYIRKDDYAVPSGLRGIGIRIEDNVLMTSTGPTVLSKSCPKTVESLEIIRN